MRSGRILRALGWTRLFAAIIRASGRPRLLRADLLCVALKRRPADELMLQSRYIAGHAPQPNGRPTVDAVGSRPWIRVVGSAGR